MPVATARAKEAKGSLWSSLSSNIKPLMSALGSRLPGRRENLAGSPPCGGREGGREGGRREAAGVKMCLARQEMDRHRADASLLPPSLPPLSSVPPSRPTGGPEHRQGRKGGREGGKRQCTYRDVGGFPVAHDRVAHAGPALLHKADRRQLDWQKGGMGMAGGETPRE